jgi:hypothetical protein
MSRFQPANVWAWWQEKKGWKKWALLAIAVIGVVLAAIWWLFYHLPDEDPKKESEASEGLVDGLEGHFDKTMEEIKEKDKEISAKIEKEQEGRKENQAEREKIMEENKNVHDQIDGADSVDDLVDGWNKNRRRR